MRKIWLCIFKDNFYLFTGYFYNHETINVCGTTQPVLDIGTIARKHGLMLLLDTAQSAGSIPVNMKNLKADIVAFTGHKGLLGPTGTGGLVFGDRVDINRIHPLIMGGTGSRSEYENHPEFLPDRFKAGALNVAGLAGLKVGISFTSGDGFHVQSKKRRLSERLISGLSKIDAVSIQGCPERSDSTPVISMIIEGVRQRWGRAPFLPYFELLEESSSPQPTVYRHNPSSGV